MKPTTKQPVIPNLISDNTPAGVAHIIKTARLDHTVTQADLDGAAFYLQIFWKTPFKDTGYSVSLNLEVENGLDPRVYSIGSFYQDQTKLTVAINSLAPAVAAAGDLMCLHAIAIHD